MAHVRIKAEIAGRVSALPIAVGTHVEQGDDIAIIEAMKMEIPLSSPASGTIREVLVAIDEVVAEGQVLVVLDE
jgi:acetyl-CoA carboxylase biotin carboxyl carrier protein